MVKGIANKLRKEILGGSIRLWKEKIYKVYQNQRYKVNALGWRLNKLDLEYYWKLMDEKGPIDVQDIVFKVLDELRPSP